MRLQPKSKIFVNMLQYGTVLGGLAGALAMVVLILSADTFHFLSNILPLMVIEVLSIAVFGMIYGGLLGLIAGIVNGLSMMLVTSLFYADIPSQNSYKLVMGITSAIMSSLFLISLVWHLRLDGMSVSTWNITMLALVTLAIYASQQVSSAYLYEWSLRKQKSYS